MGNPAGRPRPHDWRVGNHGYRVLWSPGHECADKHGYVLEHVLVASKALGRPLPDKAQVHHVNEIKTDNRPGNLAICPDRPYHMLLHQRRAALDACGHADWRKCVYCNQYDDPAKLAKHGPRSVNHLDCYRTYRRARYHARRNTA
jgi:hypothetical protein